MSADLDYQRIPLIYQRIPKIMNELKAVKKDKAAMGYKFRGVDDVYLACQKVLADNGVFTVPEVIEERSEERTSRAGAVLVYRILKMRFKFFAEDGSFVEATVIGEGMDSGDKASNKAMSVAHKYAILQVFMIPTDEPKDPEIDSHEVTPKRIDSRPPSAPLNANKPVGLANEQAASGASDQIKQAAIKNGWTGADVYKLLNQELKKASLEACSQEELSRVLKCVSNYKPMDILK